MAEIIPWNKAITRLMATNIKIKCIMSDKEVIKNEFFDFFYREKDGKWIQILVGDKFVTWGEMNSHWEIIEVQDEG